MSRRVVGAVAAGLLATALAAPARGDAQSRIVGGSPAPAGSWPAIVAVIPAGGTNLDAFCGGTLIDPQWVLSAAHCFAIPQTDQPSEVAIVAGVTDLNETGQTKSVTTLVRHPGFDAGTLVNDVELVRLATPVTLGPTVATMDLVSPLRPDLWDSGSPAEIAGWGALSEGAPPPPLPTALHQATVPMVADGTCASLLGGAGFQAPSMLCAGPLSGGVDTCQGDSGGPLTVRDGAVRTLVGATSWGIGCAQPNLPGVYSRLDALRSFVFGPSGLNKTVPTAPTNVSAAIESGSATLSWTAPVSDGGRAISAYGVRIVHDGVPEALVPFPGTATQGVLTGLVLGHSYAFTVLAANAVGLGPAVPPAPINTVAPEVIGVPRVGRPVQASAGSWTDLASTSLQWQACDTAGQACADIPAATAMSFTPTKAETGKRLQVRVTAQNAGGIAEATASAPGPVLPVYAIRILRAARASQGAAGRITVTARARMEGGGRILVRIVDHRGKPRRLIQAASRIAGKRPRRAGPSAFTAVANASGVLELRIAFAGDPRNPRRAGRLVLVATDARGERAVLKPTFRAPQ